MKIIENIKEIMDKTTTIMKLIINFLFRLHSLSLLFANYVAIFSYLCCFEGCTILFSIIPL